MTDGETHYEVLGIQPGASKEEVRAAYQEQIDAIRADQASAQEGKRPDEGALQSARDREGDVRKAWQVLSDPYQRGRYDVTIESGAAPDGDGGGGDVEVLDDAPTDPRAARRAQRQEAMRNRPPGLLSPEPGKTPDTWPPGLHAPPNRARTLAMLVDLAALAVIFIASQFIGVYAIDEIYPKETTKIDRLTTQIDNLEECIDDRPNSPNNEPKGCRAGDQPSGDALTKSKLESKRDNLEEARDQLQSDISPATFGILGAVLLASLLYLVPSSIRSGRTLGKKLFQIRAVQTDGSPLGFRAATLRYATPVLLALLLLSLGLGPLAVVLVLFGVLTWPRNPNKQGLQDRLAGTLVVDG